MTAENEASPPEGGATLLLGIDLGTSRTAVVSSRGTRVNLSTYVGRPKDVVSEKLLGKRLLFGDEALRHRLSLDLYRPLEKGVIQWNGEGQADTLDAIRQFVRYAVSLAAPREDDVIHAVVGAPAQASVRDKKALIEACGDALDAVMIASEPFCVAYGLGVLTDALILDIGAGTMDLCRMHGTLPGEDDQVTIDKAGDFIDRTLFELLRRDYPEAQFTIHMIRRIKEDYGYVSGAHDRVVVTFPVEGRPRQFDITEQIQEACHAIVPDLTEAIYRLIGTFDPEFQQRLRDNVIVCGGGSQLAGLRTLVEKALDELGGGKVSVVGEPVFAGASGALRIAHDMPASFWERLDR
ncbi:MAG: rod shape-determining protein [Deferrisomatales bacterium]